MTLRRYRLRRLNPFRGVTCVLEIDEARAISGDGLNWEVQVQTERPVGWGSLNLNRVETVYYRYGVWSPAEGFARYPVHPALDRARLHRAADRLVEALQARDAMADAGEGSEAQGAAGQAADRLECWLLDAANGLPLALLGAATAATAMPARVSSRWHAAPGDAETRGQFGRERVEAVERAVARRGGSHAWFERLADGSGRKVGSGDAAPLPRAVFPELLLDESWPDADAAAHVAAYHGWLAPRLLMLPLAATTRARLERACVDRAGEVAHFFRLYPAIADAALLNALRVEARLTESA